MKEVFIIIFIVSIFIILLYFFSYNIYSCEKNSSMRKLSEFVDNNDVLLCYDYDENNLEKYNKNIFLSHKNNYFISNKLILWKTLNNYYGTKIAKTITPMTFAIPEDYDEYTKYAVNKKMIFKQNTHRQEGLFVTDRIQSKDFLEKQEFIVGQEFISNSLKYNKQKLSFRMYLIIECIDNVLKEYIYDDGLVYYGKDDIASFYEAGSSYEKNPIIISELEKIMNIQIRNLMIDKLKMLVDAIRTGFCSNIKKYKFYELYGVDFQITNDFDCYILEVNSGPGMDPNDSRDKFLRDNLMKYYSNILRE
jgi:hypothetical protein